MAWERRMDELMREQAQARESRSGNRRSPRSSASCATSFPAIYFVASARQIATTMRVVNAEPALQLPQLLWSADTLAVSGTSTAR